MSDPPSRDWLANTVSLKAEQAATADGVLGLTLARVLEAASGDSNDKSDELLDFQVVLTDPLARITTLPTRPLNVVGAVARFVWMISHSNRLEDIAFYEPRVRAYSDDKISVPGSNYGQRIFQPVPNLNQIAEGVVPRLRAEKDSRRAAVVIWNPHDAVRASNDIPCAFGAFYHIRHGVLVATTIMRSNNAVRLLPFNTFEFSLVAEIIAREVGVDLGAYVHFSASMHVLDIERQAARSIVEEWDSQRSGLMPSIMAPMPASPPPLEQAAELARLEAAMRHDHVGLASGDLDRFLPTAAQSLDPYWLGFYQVLLAHALIKSQQFDAAGLVVDQLPVYFRASVARALQKDRPTTATSTGQLALEIGALDARLDTGLGDIEAAFAPTAAENNSLTEQLLDRVGEIERSRGNVVHISAIQALHRRLVVNRSIRLAARSEDRDPQAGAQARNRLSVTEVQEALEAVEREQLATQ